MKGVWYGSDDLLPGGPNHPGQIPNQMLSKPTDTFCEVSLVVDTFKMNQEEQVDMPIGGEQKA